MFNNKSGFTLSEMLIILSIIGVIAALTIPPVMDGIEKGKTGATLARSVQQIESGCQKIVMAANANSNGEGVFDGYSGITLNDLYDGRGDAKVSGKALFSSVSSFFGATELSDNGKEYAVKLKEYGGTDSNVFENGMFASHDKLGTYFGVFPIPDKYEDDENSAILINANEINPITDLVLIDTNGSGAPNRYGMDIFLFGLTDKCNLIPAGTEKMKDLGIKYATVGKTFNQETKDGCNSGNVTQGLSCTARVVRDGFKIKY